MTEYNLIRDADCYFFTVAYKKADETLWEHSEFKGATAYRGATAAVHGLRAVGFQAFAFADVNPDCTDDREKALMWRKGDEYDGCD